tara:strand:- start:2848 stop:3180 length:333 start_codon:yes stop_codon:yes gene_type:complete
MDESLKKKLMGAAAAGVAAFMFGGSQIMGMDDRLATLEALHPEIAQAELDAIAEELKENPPALGKPGMSAPPIEDPNAEHLELNESDEWVVVEETEATPVEEVSEEVEED